MSKLLTKILITRAANTNLQLLFKCNFTHSTTDFLLLSCPSIKVQKIGLLLAKTALSSYWTLTHGYPSEFWQKCIKKTRSTGDQLNMDRHWVEDCLVQNWRLAPHIVM